MTATLKLIDTEPYERKLRDIRVAEIKELWDLGILNPLGYTALCLLAEGAENLDIEGFCQRWQGSPDHQTEKVRKLTPKQVKLAIIALEDKGAIEVPDVPIQLRLNFGG